MNRAHAAKNQQKDRGFTLIELLVALGVFTVGMLGILTMLVAAVQYNRDAQDMAMATNLAANQLELLRMGDLAGLVAGSSGSDTYASNGDASGTPYFTVTWSVADESTSVTVPSASIVVVRKVVVQTDWKRNPGDTRTRSVQLNTEIAEGI
jgi:type IV pilus assembly protein PilV